jgi:porin
MKVARVGTLCLIAVVTLCGAARAQEQGPWWTWSTIDGDWGGYRHLLADRGLVFSGTTVADLQGNISGGQRRGFAPADSSLFAIDADLQALAGLDDLLFHTEFTVVEGQNLSTKTLGNVLQVATAYAQPGYYLGQMYAQQKLFDDKLILQAGRMTTANNFASLPIFNDYVSFTDNPIPVSLTDNTIYFTSLPAVTWAVIGTIAPIESVALAGGVYDTNLASAEPFASRHGVDLSFDENGGPMEVAQATYYLNHGSDENGLPGTYNIGGFYSGADYQAVSGRGSKSGNYGFYLEAQQMIYRYGGAGSDVGLTPWFALSYNPEQSINQLPLLVMVGLAYQGLLPGRSDDSTAFAFYYGKLNTTTPIVLSSALIASSAATTVSGEKILELDYTCWATPWLGVTPDLQYILNPRGSSGSKNAAVIGVQFQVLF